MVTLRHHTEYFCDLQRNHQVGVFLRLRAQQRVFVDVFLSWDLKGGVGR